MNLRRKWSSREIDKSTWTKLYLKTLWSNFEKWFSESRIDCSISPDGQFHYKLMICSFSRILPDSPLKGVRAISRLGGLVEEWPPNRTTNKWSRPALTCIFGKWDQVRLTQLKGALLTSSVWARVLAWVLAQCKKQSDVKFIDSQSVNKSVT